MRLALVVLSGWLGWLCLFAQAAHARQPEPKHAEKARRARPTQKLGKRPALVISLYNAHTKEWLAVDAIRSRARPAPAITNEFFRCHFTNDAVGWDRRLLTIIIDAALRFQKERVLVISGYRAPKYNLMLKKKGREVAGQSQHTLGTAVDFSIPGVPTKRLLGFVRRQKLGGAGFYPESGFVHADTGRIRTWTGR